MKIFNIISPRGTLDRSAYIYLTLFIYFLQVINLAYHFDRGGSVDPYKSYEVETVKTILIFSGILLWVKICLVRKRLNDIGGSDWLLIFTQIPIISFLFDLYLFDKKSLTKEDGVYKKKSTTIFLKAIVFIFVLHGMYEYFTFYQPFNHNWLTPRVSDESLIVESDRFNKTNWKYIIHNILNDHKVTRQNVADLLPGVTEYLPVMDKPNYNSDNIDIYNVRWCLARNKVIKIITNREYHFSEDMTEEFNVIINETAEICTSERIIENEYFNLERQILQKLAYSDLENLVKKWILKHYRRLNVKLDVSEKDMADDIISKLKDLRYLGAKLDSLTDDRTIKAIEKFKRDNGLEVDGDVTYGFWLLLLTKHRQYKIEHRDQELMLFPVR
ncbi:MAG: DUF805 domain-containing protein [Sutterella sp.]|nr:DUF805 domain-containing protein [Sutterella sp.]